MQDGSTIASTCPPPDPTPPPTRQTSKLRLRLSRLHTPPIPSLESSQHQTIRTLASTPPLSPSPLLKGSSQITWRTSSKLKSATDLRTPRHKTYGNVGVASPKPPPSQRPEPPLSRPDAQATSSINLWRADQPRGPILS